MQKPIRILSLLFLTIVLFAAAALPVCADLAKDGKIVVVLDPGHGGIDGGTAAGKRTEKENNLLIAQAMAEILGKNENFEVILTRDTDVYLTFIERTLVAKENNADLFVSLHCNSSTESYPNGSTAYISVVDRFAAWDLAGAMLDNISASVPIRRGKIEQREDTGGSIGIYYWNDERQWDMPGDASLGIKSDYYSVITFCSKFGIPSMIMEHGYCSNPGDDAVLSDDAGVWAIADAECRAIIDYYTGHEHVFGPVETDYPSNCMWHGTASSRCTVCGAKSGTVDLPEAPENHYWRILESIPPTCTEEGWVRKICQIENNLMQQHYDNTVEPVEEILPPAGHTFEIFDETPAGHGQDGHYHKRCTVCGYEEEESIPGEPHTYEVTEEIAPTCTAPGRRVSRCTVCGDIINETVPSPGHQYELTKTVDATPTEEGYEIWTCSVCGNERTEVISVCPHEYDIVETAPTCTEPGRLTYTCRLCGYVRMEELPAAGHSYEAQMSVDPTCTEEGFFRGQCTVCGDVISERIPAAGHHFVTAEDGRRFCTICGTEDGEAANRSIGQTLKSPAVIIIVAVVLIQFVTVAVLLIRHSRDAKQRRPGFRF